MATRHQTDANILYIRNLIEKKTSNKPFYATLGDITNVVSNVDHFPYTRFYKGDFRSSEPIVAARQAGLNPNYKK